MANEQTIGTHRVRIDDDAVLVRWIGTPEYEDVRTIHQHLDRVLAAQGRLFVINDMRHSGIPSAQTRKWIAQWTMDHPVVAIVNFGASLPVRALQGLLLRAGSLMGRKPLVELVNCGSESEALDWIATRRRLLFAT